MMSFDPKDTVEWSNVELERSVRAMEANVIALESGNPEADDSEMKQKYDNQKQLNVQLQEQKRWLEHELEQEPDSAETPHDLI